MLSALNNTNLWNYKLKAKQRPPKFIKLIKKIEFFCKGCRSSAYAVVKPVLSPV